jgi:hypothetical protein
MILAYCLGERGLSSVAAWAASMGADISNVALLYRLRQCGNWLAFLIGHALASSAPTACRGRLIRIIDGTAELDHLRGPKTIYGASRPRLIFRANASGISS